MKTRTPAPVIEFKGLEKRFDSIVLADINIDLYPGEVHVLIGENGSGKSTLMKLLGGWFPPDGGTILYKGEPCQFSSIHEAGKAGILYLHQDVQSFDNLSVAENIYFNIRNQNRRRNYLFEREKIHADCREVFNELGVRIDPLVLLGSLGYAERQLVAAVRAYITPAEVLIFDEPSSAMAEPDREILFSIVKTLKARGTAIFYISHRMDEIRQVGDRVTVLHQGRIVGTCGTSEVDREGLLRMMSGQVLRDRYPRLEAKRGPLVMRVENLALEPTLKDVSFDLHQGEILGITGLMGSGRTLLANCLFGVVKPKSGRIIINKKVVTFSNPKDAMDSGLSLIPEDRVNNGIFPKHNLVRNLTSATLRRFLDPIALDEKFMWELSKKYVSELSIVPGLSDDILETYSGGNQQKVVIGRWLMNRSRIYIMDEPTRGIDAASKIDIYNTMNDMLEKNAAIILISSEIEEILGMSDRILVLAGGRISSEMSRSEASKEKILLHATEEE